MAAMIWIFPLRSPDQRVADFTTVAPRGPTSASRPSPISARPVTGTGCFKYDLAEGAPAIGGRRQAPPHVGEQQRTVGHVRRADDRCRQTRVGFHPRRSGVVAAVDVAAKAECDDSVSCRRDTEETALVRDREHLEALCRGIELHHEPAFAGDVEFTADRADRVEIEELGVVRPIEPRLPGLAAVGRTENEVVRTHDVAVCGIGKPDVEKRLVGALLLVALRLGQQCLHFRGGRLRLGPAFHGREQQVVRLVTVELHLPTIAAIVAVEDDTVVADRPSISRVGEEHGGQVRAYRDGGLLPGLATVVRHDDVPTLSDSDQAVARFRDRLQQCLARERRGLRRCVEYVDERRADCRRSERHAERSDASDCKGATCRHDSKVHFRSCRQSAVGLPAG